MVRRLQVVGYRWAGLSISDSELVAIVGSLSEAKSVCLAALVVSGKGYCAVAIHDGEMELARYRAFPAGRPVDRSCGDSIEWARGARLSVGVSGRRVKDCPQSSARTLYKREVRARCRHG